jgi:hypothetical protein
VYYLIRANYSKFLEAIGMSLSKGVEGKYQYLPLSYAEPKVVTIPPLVPHSAINLSDEPCVVINAVIRHGQAHPDDYRPVKPPFPYDLDRFDRLVAGKDCPIAA